MSATLFADTSALARAYLADEHEHPALRSLLLESERLVIVSALARVELTSALHAAARAGRLHNATEVEHVVARDCSSEGPLRLVALRSRAVLSEARRLLARHPLHTLDALQLAVALVDGTRIAERLVFVTRDARQAEAARAEGLVVDA